MVYLPKSTIKFCALPQSIEGVLRDDMAQVLLCSFRIYV